MIKGKLLIPNASKPFDGKYILGHDGYNLRFSSDGGLTFATLSIPVNDLIKVRAAISGDGKYIRIVATGRSIASMYWQAIIGSDDYGATWVDVVNTSDVGSIKMSNDASLMIAVLDGSYDYAMYSTNKGYSWSVASYGITKGGMKQLALSDNGQYAFAASEIQYATYPTKSDDNGLNWNDQAQISSNRCGGVAMSANGQYRLIVYTPESTTVSFFVSSNYGYSYSQISSPGNTWATDPCVSHAGGFQCFSENMGGNSGIYVSNSHGAYWDNYSNYGVFPAHGQLVIPFADEQIWYLFPYTGNSYYVSENAGSQWSQRNIGFNLRFLAMNKFNLQ